jgi:transglutaminase-like putative cysteine protease
VALRILWTLVRGVWIAAMVAAPLFGFWLASSLAAYNNASQWLALLVGLALFPIVPFAWEAFASWRRSKKPGPPPILTRLDRLVLRTLIINGLFLAGMLGFARQTALHAVALRGDWMFDGYEGGAADRLRGGLLWLADRLESHKQEPQFGASDKPPPEPTPQPKPPATPEAKPEWPMDEEVSPLVAEMPADAQVSIDAVGKYLETNFPDLKQRTKAIHDYVVLRLTYDEATFKRFLAHDTSDWPAQDAETVFEKRTGVCEGYARLMVALGKASGVSIAYVTGSVRNAHYRIADGDEATMKAALEGYGHAWNAVMLDGKWQLIDATWDDPTGAAPSGSKVRSTYLLTPPEFFVYDHLPDDPNWQLLSAPLSTGDFVREPMMDPDMGRYGIGLLDPTRAQVSVDGEITITLHNPRNAAVMAFARTDGSDGQGEKCNASATKITCKLGHGEYEVQLFASAQQYGDYDYIGSVLANSR